MTLDDVTANSLPCNCLEIKSQNVVICRMFKLNVVSAIMTEIKHYFNFIPFNEPISIKSITSFEYDKNIEFL